MVAPRLARSAAAETVGPPRPGPVPWRRHPRRGGGAERAAPPLTPPRGRGGGGTPRTARGPRWGRPASARPAPARWAASGETSAFPEAPPPGSSPERGKVAPSRDGIRNLKSGNHQATPGLTSQGGPERGAGPHRPPYSRPGLARAPSRPVNVLFPLSGTLSPAASGPALAYCLAVRPTMVPGGLSGPSLLEWSWTRM
ncbi:translation initiation factor IF-2-like [Panthera pardus]|uniref:Translation initiation factor IF-2-like n=1 Tax=Panthera pardus TaxID=9691 RepID=A0A9V1FH75_PANPR|nr:translation initiation factor IF-2-like [Panthera pardus]